MIFITKLHLALTIMVGYLSLIGYAVLYCTVTYVG
jgi:hypothetical protein